jgi:hypothetical protein
LGPESQNDDIIVEGAIRLRPEHHFTPEILSTAIDSVQPRLEQARLKRSHAIVGLYRILPPDQANIPESLFELLRACGQEQPSLLNVHCVFSFVGRTASETSLRAFMRKGETWEQIEELTVPVGPSSRYSRPTVPDKNTDETGQSDLRTRARFMIDFLPRIDRFWVGVTVAAVLCCLLAANLIVLSSTRQTPRQTVNLQPIMDRIGQLSATVANLEGQVHAAAPGTPEAASPAAQPIQADVAPQPIPSSAPVARTIAAVASPVREAPPAKQQPLHTDVPPKRVFSSPPVARISIVKNPVTLQPRQVFQFKVSGNPAPRVVWSLQGPGSIDPVYGIYRAPDRFTGETKVKVTAKSWEGTQSVSFTLRGPNALEAAAQ